MGFRRYRGCGCLENTLRDIHMSKIGAGLFFEDRSTHCPLQTSLVSHSSPSWAIELRNNLFVRREPFFHIHEQLNIKSSKQGLKSLMTCLWKRGLSFVFRYLISHYDMNEKKELLIPSYRHAFLFVRISQTSMSIPSLDFHLSQLAPLKSELQVLGFEFKIPWKSHTTVDQYTSIAYRFGYPTTGALFCISSAYMSETCSSTPERIKLYSILCLSRYNACSVQYFDWIFKANSAAITTRTSHTPTAKKSGQW